MSMNDYLQERWELSDWIVPEANLDDADSTYSPEKIINREKV